MGVSVAGEVAAPTVGNAAGAGAVPAVCGVTEVDAGVAVVELGVVDGVEEAGTGTGLAG